MDSNTHKPLVFIQLGRFGDELILLPCWQRIWQDTGEKPVVVVCSDFADVFRGVTYVQPDVIKGHWYASLPTATLMARLKYGENSYVITQCHGHGWSTDQTAHETFGHAMRARAGFPGPYQSWPILFDRRNPAREAALRDRHLYGKGKPVILYNFMGLSSPFRGGQEVLQRLRKFENKFHFVNLGQVKAVRLYDLLGLYDVAQGLISIDTSTLHLAAASSVPLLAYCRGGWSSAIPKAGATAIEYKDANFKLDLIDQFLETAKR